MHEKRTSESARAPKGAEGPLTPKFCMLIELITLNLQQKAQSIKALENASY